MGNVQWEGSRPQGRRPGSGGPLHSSPSRIVPGVTVLESPEGHAHLVIPRFDRTDAGPLHQHTPGGGSFTWTTTSREPAATRNTSGPCSSWVSPRPAWLRATAGWSSMSWPSTRTATHQMRVADKRRDITYDDLEGVGRSFGIRAPFRSRRGSKAPPPEAGDSGRDAR